MQLLQPLTDGEVGLLPLTDEHVDALRNVCALDRDIWGIYPYSLLDEHFAPTLQAIRSKANRYQFVAMRGPALVGMTSYSAPDLEAGTVEIGGTYIAPSERGTDYNRRIKTLLIEHAFACGFCSVIFQIDTRNGRSMRAVEKLGAERAATLTKNMTTWTGYVRDTAVFSLSKSQWERTEG